MNFFMKNMKKRYSDPDPLWNRILIHFFQIWIPESGSGFTSKWDGSETLYNSITMSQQCYGWLTKNNIYIFSRLKLNWPATNYRFTFQNSNLSFSSRPPDRHCTPARRRSCSAGRSRLTWWPPGWTNISLLAGRGFLNKYARFLHNCKSIF